MEDTIQITVKEYKSLLADSKKLEALESGGVDNWQGYDFAMSLLKNEDEDGEELVAVV